MMKRVGKWLTVAMIMTAGVGSGKSDTAVESTRAVESPDGKKTVVVDRFTPAVDGQVDRFSGRMLLRVTSKDGAPARQRYIEASQVRVIQPPVWLDGSRLCAFVYNVAKNSSGIVYFEPETNRAVQVEFVRPARTMAASGKTEFELMSLEVTEFAGTETLRTHNIPWKGGSAFPLVIDELPEYQGQPFSLEFYNKVNRALASYRAFLKKHNLKALEPEQASESFSADEKWLGLLACGGDAAWVVGVPLGASTTEQALAQTRVAALPGVNLSCMQHSAADSTEPSMDDNRFLTAWKPDNVLEVIRESYGAESDEPEMKVLKALDMATGRVSDLSTTAPAAAPAP